MQQRGLNASAPAFTPRFGAHSSTPTLRRGASHTTPTKMPSSSASARQDAIHAVAARRLAAERASRKLAAQKGFARRQSQKLSKRNGARAAPEGAGKENRSGVDDETLAKSLSNVTLADDRPVRQSLSIASVASVGIEPRSPAGKATATVSEPAGKTRSFLSKAMQGTQSAASSGAASGPGSGILSGASSETSGAQASFSSEVPSVTSAGESAVDAPAAGSEVTSGTSSTTSSAFSAATLPPPKQPTSPPPPPAAPSPPLPELLTGSVPTVAASGRPPSANVLSRLPSCTVDINATPRTSAVSNSGSSGPPPATAPPVATTMSAGKWCDKCAGVGLHVAAMLSEIGKQPRVDVMVGPAVAAGASGSLASKGGGWKRRMSQTIIGDRGAAKAAETTRRLQQQVDVLTTTVAFMYEKLQAAGSAGPAVDAAYNRCVSHI